MDRELAPNLCHRDGISFIAQGPIHGSAKTWTDLTITMRNETKVTPLGFSIDPKIEEWMNLKNLLYAKAFT
jgi:hypothetical protein